MIARCRGSASASKVAPPCVGRRSKAYSVIAISVEATSVFCS